MGLEKISDFCDSLSESDSQYNVEETYNKFMEFYGKEKGEEKFLEALKEGYNNNFSQGLYDPNNLVEKAEFDEHGNVVITFANGDICDVGELKYIDGNILTYMYSEKYKEGQLNDYLENLEKTTNINYQELLLEHAELSQYALGDANAVSNILTEYISSQESFIDVLASGAQIGGMVSMSIGAVATLCGAPFGPAVLKGGQALAIGGTFGDELAEGFDTLTNKQGFEKDKEHYREILKETCLDGALFFSGMAIGGYASGVADDVYSSAKSFIQSKTGNELFAKVTSKLASITTEIGIDGTLSLLTDLTITGEIDLDGETFSQLLGILTGTAMARLNNADAGNIKLNTNTTSQNPRTTGEFILMGQGDVKANATQTPKLFTNIKRALEFKKLFPEIHGQSFETFKKQRFDEEGIRTIEELQTKYGFNEVESMYLVYRNYSETQIANFQTATKEYNYSFEDSKKLISRYSYENIESFKLVLDSIEKIQTTYKFNLDLSSRIYDCSNNHSSQISTEKLSQIMQAVKNNHRYSDKECTELLGGVEAILRSKLEPSIETLEKFIKIKDITQEDNKDIIKIIKAGFDDAEIRRYLEIKEKIGTYDADDAIKIVQENFSDEQLARYMEIKQKFGCCYVEEVKYNLTDEEIKYHHELRREPDCFSAQQTKIYRNALKSGLNDAQAKLAVVEGYTMEDVGKIANAISQFNQLKSKHDTISLFARLNSSEINHLKTCMVQYRIFDFADFNKYVKEIDKTELFELAPELKKAPKEEILDFFSYHYAAGTEKFDAETLSMDGNLTTYLAQNYTSAYQLTRLLNAHPLASRNVGELPNGWLTSTDPEIQAQKTTEIHDTISDFQKTSNSAALEESLATILGKNVEVEYIGSGALGTAYKITVQDSEPVCLKIFAQGREEYGVSRHGEHIEPQVALFANQHSNNFAHMFFGRVSGLNDSDGFMVTQFLDRNTTPIQNATDTESFSLWCGDNNGDNNIGSTYIDFGKLGISDKNGNVIHLWYETTYKR